MADKGVSSATAAPNFSPTAKKAYAIIRGMEKPATDIYTFEDLRRGGFTYVDKTGMILPLADLSIGKQFFLSRPRRFGKSLLISTLRALFEGRRELFKGLEIEPKWDWSRVWTVLHLDMGSCQAETVERLWDKIDGCLISESDRLGVPLRPVRDVSRKFRHFIDDLAAKSPSEDGQIVLLVDEYDKPLLGHLSKPDVLRFRDALKEFYSVIKTMEAKQRFTFLTGVSKFSKVSVFSDLNNLTDLTMSPGAATLLGYTHDELRKFFPETLGKIGRANGRDADWAFREVIKWYDGYKFEEDGEKVVNPVSFGCCARDGKFDSYWSKTAMTTFLTDALREHPLDFSTLGIDESELEAYEPDNPRLVTLLYQTGYLTIKSFRQTGVRRKFDLCFPNLEVESSFLTALAPIYAGLDPSRSSSFQFAAAEAILAGDVEGLVKALKGFFANIPYDLTDRQNEQMWQAIVYVVLKAIGIDVFAEVKTNEGRIDMTCETSDAVWLVEFKLDRPADEALAQIERNNYAEKYDLAGKRVVRIGVAFSSEKRTIVDVRVAQAAPLGGGPVTVRR